MGIVACKIPGTVACTLEARPAISIAVRDSVTAQSLNNSATAIVRDGSYADTARTPVPGADYPISLAHERQGTYSVTVSVAGYREWLRSNVRVTRDECHVETVQLTALMQK